MIRRDDQEAESPWWGEGLRFSCLGCGRCCRGEPGSVWLLPADEERLARCLELSLGEFRSRFALRRAGRWSLRERANYDCVLLADRGMRCGGYGGRPLQCRLFPFWPSVVRSPTSWERAARRCPGMNGGRLWTSDLILRLLSRSPFPDL
jgi:hypothetical protein